MPEHGVRFRKVFPLIASAATTVLITTGIPIYGHIALANPGEFLWQDATQQGQVFDIAALGGRVFAAGRAGTVVNSNALIRAYDAKSGNLLWQQQTDDYVTTAVIVAGQTLIGRARAATSITTSLTGYDAVNGSILWQDQFSGQSNGRIAGAAGRIFVAGAVTNTDRMALDFFVRAYDRDIGTLLWQDQVGGPGSGISDEAWAWDVATNGSALFAVGYGINGQHPLIRAYDARNGQLLWQDQSEDRGEARRVITVQDRVLVIGWVRGAVSQSWFVREYDAHSGSLIWQVLDDTGVEWADVTATGSLVLIGGAKLGVSPTPADLLVRSYDVRDGTFVWEDRLAGLFGQNFVSTVTAMGNQVFAAGLHRDSSGNPGMLVRAYDARTGTVLWTDQIANTAPGGAGLGGLATAGARLFAGGRTDISFDIVEHGDFLVRAYDTH